MGIVDKISLLLNDSFTKLRNPRPRTAAPMIRHRPLTNPGTSTSDNPFGNLTNSKKGLPSKKKDDLNALAWEILQKKREKK